jgi:hypothetical protein
MFGVLAANVDLRAAECIVCGVRANGSSRYLAYSGLRDLPIFTNSSLLLVCVITKITFISEATD